MKLKFHCTRTFLIIFVTTSLILFNNNFTGTVSAQHFRNYDIELNNNLELKLKLSVKLESVEAKHFRKEIDILENPENPDGLIYESEIDAYESQYSFEALDQLKFISIDDTAAKVVSYSMELSGVGTDSYSEAPFYKNLTATATWPSVDINATNHKFTKSHTEPITEIEITFGSNWRIKKYTGINNSKLSDGKRMVSGQEFEGFLVVVEFKKYKEKDQGLFSPGFDGFSQIIVISFITIILYLRKR